MDSTPPNEPAALPAEFAQLRARLAEAEETLAALLRGDADAVVVGGKVFTLIEQRVAERTAELRAANDLAKAARVQAEDALDALRESEQRFRDVVENISEVCWMTDATRSRILYVSPAFEAVWGRPGASLQGDPQSFIQTIHEGDRPRVAQAIASGARAGRYSELTYRIVRPDGTLRWVRDRAYPVKNATGAVVRIVGVAEDVTEQKKLEEQFLRAQRVENLGMLAAGISHDFNNVLAPIGMAVSLLRTTVTTPGELRLLDTLEKSSARGVGLVKQILGFAHGVGGELRETQVKHLLRDIVEVMEETFPKSISLDEQIPADLWPVMANATQIHQVLINLCVNARDAMLQGGRLSLRGENCRLDATAAAALEATHPGSRVRPGDWLVLHVEDTGTGIPPEVLPRIWDPFFTTKEPGKGTGLGLSTVRGIVANHHGFLIVETALGRGTVFRVFLPAAAGYGSSGVSAPAVALVARGHGESILLVDDEELIRETAAAILTEAGYRVTTARDGAEAVAIFAPHAADFDLLITDLDMPRLDGPSLAREVRSLRPTTKILAMSGLVSRGADRDTTQFADAFLAKPFGNEGLLRAIYQLLSSSAPQEKPHEAPVAG